MSKVYLDHSATTPVHPQVLEAMLPFYQERFGNPSSIHAYGREAKRALEEARAQIAGLIGASPDEINFTSGGTEADNLAIMGIAFANQKKGKHIITSSIEHHAVLDTCHYLQKLGFEITYLPVSPEGIVHVEDVLEAITPETILISIMHVNNEVGTLQPIAEIGKIAREKEIVMHTDGVQSLGKIPVNVNELNVDALSASGHKIYGPKGIGCLYLRKNVKLQPLMHGGGQEFRHRPGTENLPGIVGFGKAAALAAAAMKDESEKQSFLRDRLINGILHQVPNTLLTGDRRQRIPQNASFCFRNLDSESILLSLDQKGIAASSGSACTSGSLEPSHVLTAMGLPPETSRGSVRFTLGRENTAEDIDYVLSILPTLIGGLRAEAPLTTLALHAETGQNSECCQDLQ